MREKIKKKTKSTILELDMEDEKGHNKLVAEVINRLEKNNLYIKPEKYKQRIREVKFLEVIIGLKRIKMEKMKMKSVLDWPIPKCIKNIQKFLGLTNYYHQFIKDFASIARLLHNLVKKD